MYDTFLNQRSNRHRICAIIRYEYTSVTLFVQTRRQNFSYSWGTQQVRSLLNAQRKRKKKPFCPWCLNQWIQSAAPLDIVHGALSLTLSLSLLYIVSKPAVAHTSTSTHWGLWQKEQLGFTFWEAPCQRSASRLEAGFMEESTMRWSLHSARLTQPCTLVAPRTGKQDVRRCVNSDTKRHEYGGIRGRCKRQWAPCRSPVAIHSSLSLCGSGSGGGGGDPARKLQNFLFNSKHNSLHIETSIHYCDLFT